MIYAAFGTLALLALIALVYALAESHKPLPPPRRDDRDWQGIFMKDIK